MLEQTSQPIPECFYKADRASAKAGLSPFQLAYVEKLEASVKAAEHYRDLMVGGIHSPEQHRAEMDLLVAMSHVNFLDENEPAEMQYPRDVIFSR